MNKIIYKINLRKWSLIICSLFVSNVFCAEEPDIRFRQITIPAGIDRFITSCAYVSEFLDTSMPNFRRAATRFCELLAAGRTPILEDDPNTMESGFSFPPHMVAQLPFLQLCSRDQPAVLDIGAGSGNDSIMALLAGARRVVAVDIHRKQLDACKERVSSILAGLPELINFSTFKRDFSVAGKVPEQYVGKVHAINANRVMHFMDESETAIFFG